MNKPQSPKYLNLIDVLTGMDDHNHRTVRIEDIAYYAGRSVNRHLRAHLALAEAEGHVTKFRYYTAANALAVGYELHPVRPGRVSLLDEPDDQIPF